MKEMSKEEKKEYEELKQWATDNDLWFYMPDFWSIASEGMTYGTLKYWVKISNKTGQLFGKTIKEFKIREEK